MVLLADAGPAKLLMAVAMADLLGSPPTYADKIRVSCSFGFVLLPVLVLRAAYSRLQ
jgi:hypothetical protein